ncbi:ROK family transcriptional regulator [Anaeromicrobium sediminis]|uniref:Sugar kinase n=1 Tax=Anaeromicrobium sediminis TaxID=1478221 RepID=A0A267MIE7_9FIRM|nr:ROK family transcriptional regulator [Anaeromicrobium sediminis]PAB58570.1 hypothetical protein CCE28_14845 [Anaeromicrobium sediminis]
MRNIDRADKKLMKRINRLVVLNLMRQEGPISRSHLAKKSSLNPATISSITMTLIEEGIVREIGSGESSGGRKPILLELNKENVYAIGVDMGIEKVSAGIVNIDGDLMVKETLYFSKNGDFKDKVNTIKKAIKKVINNENIAYEKVLGIGMGLHGVVNSKEGILSYAPAFNYYDINVKDYFEKEFEKVIKIQNDVRVMALGEKWFGKATECEDFILLNVGMGIGAGIYVNGELYEGKQFAAGEIGHIHITEENIRCKCGRVGCLEALASGSAIKDRFLEKIKGGETSTLRDKFKGNLEKVTSKDIYEEGLLGDEICISIMKDTGYYLGLAISILINILNPEKVLLAGGVSNAKEFIYDEIKRVVEEKSILNCKRLYIGETDLKENGGIIGAAALIIRDLFSIN